MEKCLIVSMLISSIFINTSFAMKPSWVAQLESGNGAIKAYSGSLVYYRAISRSEDYDNKVCDYAISKAKDYLKQEVKDISKIPITVQAIYEIESGFVCASTISVASQDIDKYQNELTEKKSPEISVSYENKDLIQKLRTDEEVIKDNFIYGMKKGDLVRILKKDISIKFIGESPCYTKLKRERMSVHGYIHICWQDIGNLLTPDSLSYMATEYCDVESNKCWTKSYRDEVSKEKE